MGQNTALKTRRLKKSGQPPKIREDKAQDTREGFNKKLHKTQEGEEIYTVCKIYMRREDMEVSI